MTGMRFVLLVKECVVEQRELSSRVGPFPAHDQSGPHGPGRKVTLGVRSIHPSAPR